MNHRHTELILIRHGETEWNAQGRIQGHIDVPLNTLGLAQAAALGRRFQTQSFDAVYSSDLQRAYETALPLVEQNAKPIHCDARLRERHLGVLEGLTHQEAVARHPEVWQVFKSRQAEAPLQDGEMLGAFFRRALDVLVELGERHSGERILIVTHGGVLDAAYRHATAMPLSAWRDFPVLNASVNVVSLQGGRWRIESWADVAHLSEQSALELNPVLPFTL